MCTHIAKSLQTRCKVIQNAVAAHNVAALAIHPPHPTLNWTTASHYSFLEDFELLRDSRNDIHEKPWVTPVIRSAMKQAQQIDRARKELNNCNIEIRHLHTYILDENTNLKKFMCLLKDQDDPIAGVVEEYMVQHSGANEYILSCIQQIHYLKGYTGSVTPGIHIGQSISPTEHTASPAKGRTPPESNDELDEHAGDLEDEEEDIQDEYNGLFNYVSDMPLCMN